MAEPDPAWPVFEPPPPDIASRITSLIRRRELGPGDPLPSEGELSRLLRASRSSVREAVKTLSALDVVEVRHGRGSYVGPMTLAPLAEMLLLRARLDPSAAPALLAEMVRVLLSLETGMAEAVHAGRTTEQCQLLNDLAALVQERAGRALDFDDVCRSFHLALFAPVASQLGGQLAATLWDVLMQVADHLAVHPSLPGLALGDVAEMHQQLASAAAQDPSQLQRALTRYYLGDSLAQDG